MVFSPVHRLSFIVVYNSLVKGTHSVNEIPLIAQNLLHGYRKFSFLAIGILVPIIGVQAIAQEREEETLDLMLTTALDPLGFLFCKMAASLALVFVAIIGTFPILGITLAMGGVAPKEVALLFIAQLFFAFAALSSGIVMGAKQPSFVSGLIGAYFLSVVILFQLNGYFSIVLQQQSLAGFVVLLLITFLILCSNLARVPQDLLREFNRVKPKSWRPPRLKGTDTQLWTFLGVRECGEPIAPNENPVYVAERERFFASMIKRGFDAPSILWLISILFTLTALSPISMILPSFLVILIFVPPVAASAFAGEHQHKSWESLRASLISSRQILWGKLRLAAGQGWIHLTAFYLPALLVMAILWFIIAFVYRADMYKFASWNVPRVWLGHFFILIHLAFWVFLIAVLSLWISTGFRRTFPALILSYIGSAFLLFGPLFLQLIHPRPGVALGGTSSMDIVSKILTVWCPYFVFHLWPSSQARFQEVAMIHPSFFKYYLPIWSFSRC